MVTILVTNKLKSVWEKFEKKFAQFDPGVDYEIIRIDGNVKNFSYSTQMNKGLDITESEYVLFMNDDVYPKTEDWVKELVDGLNKHNLSMVGPLSVVSQTFDDTVLYKEYQSKIPVGEGHPHRSLSGGCLLCKTETVKSIGGWDEGFEYYYEDNDLCRRMGDIKPIAMIPSVVVHHPDRTTTSKESQRFDAKAKRSKEHYIKKWGSLD